MKYPDTKPHVPAPLVGQSSSTLDMACRESLDDLQHGRIEPLDTYIDSIEARLNNMRAARAGM